MNQRRTPSRTSSRTPTNHKARKRFGQNFLVDNAIITGIVRAVSPARDDALVEIGPGQGAITGPLLELVDQLNVIELDRDLIPILLAQFANYRGLKIHQSDALMFDFNSLFKNGKKLRIVGNLPYNISTPLMFKLLELSNDVSKPTESGTQENIVQDMHFMLQKEVVLRLVAQPGDKNYGRLSIMAQYYCQVESLIDVPPESFEPSPKVDSGVVRLTPFSALPHTALNLKNFDTLVKTAFQQRRKTLRNGLKSLVGDEDAERVGLNLSLRAENISPEEYVRLSNELWGQAPIPPKADA